MSALRMEKQLAESTISLTKSTLPSRGPIAFDTSRMGTDPVTANGNIRTAKERKRKTKIRLDPTPMAYAHAQHYRKDSEHANLETIPFSDATFPLPL